MSALIWWTIKPFLSFFTTFPVCQYASSLCGSMKISPNIASSYESGTLSLGASHLLKAWSHQKFRNSFVRRCGLSCQIGKFSLLLNAGVTVLWIQMKSLPPIWGFCHSTCTYIKVLIGIWVLGIETRFAMKWLQLNTSQVFYIYSVIKSL